MLKGFLVKNSSSRANSRCLKVLAFLFSGSSTVTMDFSVLDVEKSKITVPANLVSGEKSWFAGDCL